MKILKIKIKNITCLRCEWEIDFQKPPLFYAGLFAITGPTGSGKSTILDAITLALFNKIPRFESETISNTFIEKAGSILTKNETDCFAEVDYSCAKGVYRSKWTIATNKRGNLRANDMELIDVSTNKIEAQGKKDVPAKNTELIGLTYDQFIKSILLAQGEFAKFLKSKKDERGKLLEDITGMTVYRELGKRAFEKFREKNKAIELKIEGLEFEESQLLPKEKEDELEELIQTLNKEKHNEEAEHAAIQKAIEIKKGIELIENEIEKYIGEEAQANKALNDFNEKNAERIQKHEQLLPHLNEIRNYSANDTRIKSLIEDIKCEEPELEKKNAELKETLSAISKLIGSKVEMQNAIEALTKFRDRVIYLTTNRINAEKSLSEQNAKISAHLKKPILSKFKTYESNDKIDELKSKLYAELSAVSTKTDDLINQTKTKAEKIYEQKEIYSTRLKAWQDLKLLVENYTENRDKLKQKSEEIKETQQLITSKKPELEKITASKNSINLKIEEVREKREKKLREKNFEDDRKQLKQGEPCPLCGSLHHPYVHEYLNTVSELTKEYRKLQEEEKKYELQLKHLQNEISMHEGSIDVLQKEQGRIEKEMKEQETKIANRKKQLAIEKVGNVQTIEAAITELDKAVKAMNELEKFNDAKRDLQDFKEAVDELELRTNEFIKAKSEVELRYKGSNIRGDCDSLNEQLRKLIEAIQNSETKIASFKDQLENLNQQQTKIEASLNSKLLSFGYTNILSSCTDILPDAEFNNLQHKLLELEGNIKRIQALTQSANERKQQLVGTDKTNKSNEDLLEEFNSLEQQIEQTKQTLDEYRSQKMQNDLRKNRIIKLREQVHETKQANLKWELLCKYIGDAQGKNFSTFAQSLTLKKLILLTNERLRKLNDRYLLDMPLEEESDDLIIIDTYLADERRSIKTLSGGETFIVSLALALALSDLASKNVKIESLYIDEGFGSLDPDALETAISTLEQLQIESNKTIGIISHVDSLKERIETQIQLEKNSSGFSKIVIR